MWCWATASANTRLHASRGCFGLEDGARLMAERGRLFGSLPAGGRMAAVFAAAERVESCTDEFPRLVGGRLQRRQYRVVGTRREDLERAVAGLTAEGVRCECLETSHAFHSALLDPVLDEFEAYADRFEFDSPQRTLVCNRSGAVLRRHAKLDGHYWRRHARQPVQFAESVRTLADLGCTVLLEVGPLPVLTANALRAWPDAVTAPQAIASLRRSGADRRQITEALAKLYIAGHRPDFATMQQGGRKHRPPHLSVPASPYWFRRRGSRPPRSMPRVPRPSGFLRRTGSRNSRR